MDDLSDGEKIHDVTFVSGYTLVSVDGTRLFYQNQLDGLLYRETIGSTGGGVAISSIPLNGQFAVSGDGNCIIYVGDSGGGKL